MSRDYYRIVGGRKYDRKMLEIAEEAVAGQGDGRISLADAEQLLAAVEDANQYTDIEKATMRYIRDHFRFTPAADSWFRTEIRKWAGIRGWAASHPDEPEVVPTEPPSDTAPAVPAGSAAPLEAPQAEALESVPAVTATSADSTDAATPPDETAQPEFHPPPPPPPQPPPSSTQQARRGSGWKIAAAAAVLIAAGLAAYFAFRPASRPPEAPVARQQPAPPAAPSTPAPAVAEQAPATEPAAIAPAPEQSPSAPSAPPEPEKTARAPAAAGTAGGTHTVQNGDTLWTIADAWYRDPLLWPNVFRVNRERINHPDLIRPAMLISVPPLQGTAAAMTDQDQALTAAGYLDAYDAYLLLSDAKARPYLLEAGRRDPTLAGQVREKLRQQGR